MFSIEAVGLSELELIRGFILFFMRCKTGCHYVDSSSHSPLFQFDYILEKIPVLLSERKLIEAEIGR
jgi:hypothetical protein